MSASERPPLLQLGGKEAFAEYEKEFGRLYQNQRVYDVLGNQVRFEVDTCWHICTKGNENNPSAYLSRSWSQERAERILWVLAALTDAKTEIRPDKDFSNRLNYLLIVQADPEQGLPQEYYCVVVEKLRPGLMTLITAFPMDYSGWAKRRRSGKALYPIKKKDEA